VAAVLSGAEVIPGLAVDTDLRWALLQRLVVVGRASDAEIDAELDRDDTALGRRRALTLRAARPTAAAKEEAWRAIVSGELPNTDQGAVILGFGQFEQRELLMPYVERYFESIAEIYDLRTAEMAQQIIEGLYPIAVGGQSTVDATDTYLREQQPGPALRRMLLEGRDSLARALRAQQREA
jgi:aminopeptidase N